MDYQTHQALAVPGLSAPIGLQVAVSRSAPEGPAVLTVDPGGAPRHMAVLARRLPEVPERVLALPEATYAGLGLGPDVQWWLRPQPAAEASRLVLELSNERSPETATRDIAGAGLAGTLLLADEPDQWLEIAGATYRIRDVQTDRGGAPLARIGRQTAVELFAPGVRAGVDMVILADISQSMDVDDIPASGESMLALRARGKRVRRIDALRQALSDLLNVRLQVSGRVSRVALLAFNNMTFPKFPSDGGMIELDGASPQRVIGEFQKAVDSLQPYGGTRIEVALHAAAELLYRHGHPGNERLIVLVSDGAHWTPGRDSDTGRVFEALSEPISLMEHLHRDMKVRLHAIGISTRELFLRHFRDEPGLTPDHRLLAQLVKVGGGDPATVGGLEVLVDYFSSAGGGMSHRVRGPLSAAPELRLGPAAAQALAAASRRRAPAAGLGQHLEAISLAVERIEVAAQRLFEQPLYPYGTATRAAWKIKADLPADVLVRNLVQTFKRLRAKPAEADALACVQAWNGVLARLEAPIAAEPPDLPGLAAVCRSGSTEPPDLAVAVLGALADGLADLAGALERAPTPKRRTEPAPAAVPQQPRAGRLTRTDAFMVKN